MLFVPNPTWNFVKLRSGNPCKDLLLRKVCYYSTAATDEAAYIIGGYQDDYHSQSIAEFKNDQWRILGGLTQGKYCHGSISVGQQTMVNTLILLSFL